MHRSFGIVEKDKLLYAECGKLATQLRTYGTGGSGHHDNLILKVCRDGIHGNLDFIPAKKILDFNLAHIDARRLAGKLIDYRHNQHFKTICGSIVNHLVPLGKKILLGGENNASDKVRIRDGFQLLSTISHKYRHIYKAGILQILVFGQKTPHFIVSGAAKSGHYGHRLVPHSEDKYPDSLLDIPHLGLIGVKNQYHQQPDRT